MVALRVVPLPRRNALQQSKSTDLPWEEVVIRLGRKRPHSGYFLPVSHSITLASTLLMFSTRSCVDQYTFAFREKLFLSGGFGPKDIARPVSISYCPRVLWGKPI